VSMTVRELIEHLAQFDGDMDVMYENDGCGMADGLTDINVVEVREDSLHGIDYRPMNVVVISI